MSDPAVDAAVAQLTLAVNMLSNEQKAAFGKAIVRDVLAISHQELTLALILAEILSLRGIVIVTIDGDQTKIESTALQDDARAENIVRSLRDIIAMSIGAVNPKEIVT